MLHMGSKTGCSGDETTGSAMQAGTLLRGALTGASEDGKSPALTEASGGGCAPGGTEGTPDGSGGSGDAADGRDTGDGWTDNLGIAPDDAGTRGATEWGGASTVWDALDTASTDGLTVGGITVPPEE